MEKTLEILIFTFVVLLGIRFIGDLIHDFVQGRAKNKTKGKILGLVGDLGGIVTSFNLVGYEDGKYIYKLPIKIKSSDSIDDLEKHLINLAFDAKSCGLSFDWAIKDNSVLTIKLE